MIFFKLIITTMCSSVDYNYFTDPFKKKKTILLISIPGEEFTSRNISHRYIRNKL